MERKAILFIVTTVIVLTAVYLAFPALFNLPQFSPTRPMVPTIAQFFLKLDARSSKIEWLVPGEEGYTGTLQFRFGELGQNESGQVRGSFTVDMTSLTATDQTLQKRLRSEEFFNVGRFITAEFEATGLEFIRPDNLASGTPAVYYELTGKLTVKGVTAEIKVPLLVSQEGDNLVATGQFAFYRDVFRLGPDDSRLPNEAVVSLSLVSQGLPK